nr:RNA-directed DNA polymerase [Tanacetum cinerariifolium]
RWSSHCGRYSSRKSCWFCACLSCMTRLFPPLLSSSSQSLSFSASFRIVTFPGVTSSSENSSRVTSSSENSSPQPVAAISSIGVVFMERSTSIVVIVCRLSSHLVSRRTTRAFVPALLWWSACSLIMNIPSHLMSVPSHLSVATDLIFLSRKLCLCLRRASVKDVRPSGSHFFDSLSNCSLKILLGSSKTCIFPSDLFTRSVPLIEKLSSLLAKLDIESSSVWDYSIIDTGASACCINKKVVPKEALEPLTNDVFFNGLNLRQQATHKIKQGNFLIEGNKFRIPLIYAFDMNDSNGIEMLIGANFLRSMKGGIRIEGDEIIIYKKVTKIKTSNQTEIAELEVDEEEFLEINESIYFNQEGSKAFLEQFKPVIERLKHQGYIGKEPLKHWKKNGELCKLDIINPDITIKDKLLKHVTLAMEDSFKNMLTVSSKLVPFAQAKVDTEQWQ